MAQLSVILGSVRTDRNGLRVGKWIKKILEKRNHKVALLDPLEIDLPLLNKMYKEMEEPSEKLQKIHITLKRSEGFVVVTPEYNHSISAAIKNMLDYFLEEYFFKPSAIVSYSVGIFGGIIAGTHLRQVLAEMGASAIPSQLAIPKIQNVLDSSGNLLDTSYEQRIARIVDEFEWYVEALSKQREKGTPY